jgi:hypothetical protein
MKFKTFLEKQFGDFIDVYDKYLIRTSGIALTYTLFCFVVIALLVRFSDFDPSASKKQLSMLSYFFVRYSKGDVYSIVDLSKTVFIFFVSIFSLGLTRINPSKQEKTELKVVDFLKQICIKDIIYLIVVLILCSVLDYVLFQLDSLSLSNVSDNGLDKYFHGLIFQFRIYIPLVFFGLITYRLSSDKSLNINFKKVFLLFVSLWFFNEFAYELSYVVRTHIFGLILIPFSAEKQYFVESFIGMTLIAFYFVGYHSAMSTSLKLLENER